MKYSNKKINGHLSDLLLSKKRIIFLKNHELANTLLAANIQYLCQQCKRIINVAEKSAHIQSNVQKTIKNCLTVKYVKERCNQ